MRVLSASRVRLLSHVALVTALAGLTAGCNSARFNGPLFTGSTDNQREIIGQTNYAEDSSTPAPYAPPPVYAAAEPISSAPLPAPGATGTARGNNALTYGDDGMVASSGNYAWSAVGGKVVTVKSGETLDNLAAKYGVPQQQILSANQLRTATDVRSGRVLVIPRRVAVAADATPRGTEYADSSVDTYQEEAPAAAPAPARIASAGTSYVVQSGDTLYGVARKTGMNVSELASINGISTDTRVQMGQTLTLKRGATVAMAEPKTLGAPPKSLGTLKVGEPVADARATQPMLRLKSPSDTAESGEEVAMTNAPKKPMAPKVPSVSDPATTAEKIDNAADAAATDIASTDGTSFRWPVRGRIISGFGSKPNGERNDGINLAVPEGTSIKSVEAGTVIYAGNELEGYGNLILIRHANGFVSAYAHNEDMMVKRGESIKRGQVIAHAGATGSVNSPQVHFELRKGAKPVNPLDYLVG